MRAAFLLASLLCLAPLAAGMGADGNVRAAALSSHGPTTLDGRLVAFAQDTVVNRTLGQGLSEPVAGMFDGLAVSAVARRTWTDTSFVGGTVKGLADNETITFSEATLETLQMRSGAVIYVLPSPDGAPAHVHQPSSCLDVQPSDEATVTRSPYVDARQPSQEVDTSGSLLVKGCGATDLLVEGSFTLFVWDIDLRITGNGRTQTYQTGERSLVAGLPNVASHSEDLLITVRDGRLRLPAIPSEARLYTEGASLQTDGSLLLSSATGNVGQLKVSDGEVFVEGALHVQFDGVRQADSFAAALSGHLDRLLVDGREVGTGTTIASPQASTRSAVAIWLLIGVTVALATAAAWAPARRWRARRHLRRAIDALEGGLHGDTLHFTSLAIQLNARSGAAHYYRALALALANDAVGALGDHEAANRLLGEKPRRATVDLRVANARQAAALCTALGDGDRAVWWIQVAASLDDGFRRQIEATVGDVVRRDTQDAEAAYG